MDRAKQNKEEVKWKSPSREQELSHRTILRYQFLANDLRDALNRLPFFSDANGGKINGIYFVSRDAERSKNALQLNQLRYNYKLCGSYQFPDGVWDWLNFGDKNISKFEPLFYMNALLFGKINEFKAFKNIVNKCRSCTGGCTKDEKKPCAINHNHRNDRSAREIAHELLIDAIASMPYRGALLSLFEKAFNNRKVECCWFSGSEKSFTIYRFNEFKYQGDVKLVDNESQEKMSFLSAREIRSVLANNVNPKKIGKIHGSLISLFENFVNPFTRASDKFRTTPQAQNWPYTRNKSDIMNGFVVPVYDTWTKKGWRGGMAGWLAFFCEGNNYRSVFNDRVPDDATWTAFTLEIQNFLRRVKESRVRELLAEYAELGARTTMIDFFEGHIHHLIGWKRCLGPSKYMNLTCNGNQNYRIPVEKLGLTKWDTTTDKYPEDPERLVGRFPKGTRLLCSQFLEWLHLIEKTRKSGICQVEDMLGHEVIKAYDPVLSVIRYSCGRSNYSDGFIIELSETALMYGLIMTPSAASGSWLDQLEDEHLCRLAWRLYLLRDVIGSTVADISPESMPNLLNVWNDTPTLRGHLMAYMNVTDGTSRYVSIHIMQIQLILLINAMKHHYGRFYNKGDFGDMRIAKLLNVCRTRQKIKVSCMQASNMLNIVVMNRYVADPIRKFNWNCGTPQALDTSCRAIYESLGVAYERDKVMQFHFNDATGVAIVSCQVLFKI